MTLAGGGPVLPQLEDKLALTRLSIGHTRLAHGKLMDGDDALFCEGCEALVMVAYV